MNVTVIGTGFVGVVTAVVYSSLGHRVWGLDIDQHKIDSLRQGDVPFWEPDLAKLLTDQLRSGRLTFTTNYQTAVAESEVVIIAVGTPSTPEGEADLRYVWAACESLAPHLQPEAVVAIKSTVPPGTLPSAERIIVKHDGPRQPIMAALPEFLREGSAVADTLKPDRVVIGAVNQHAIDQLTKLHQDFAAKIVVVSPESAQLGKYAANAYLAARITFINQVADLCQRSGANVEEVIEVIGHDQRIGRHYWYPGFGYGGSCFPKDVNELAAYSRRVNESDNLFNKLSQLNSERIPKLMDQYASQVGGFADKQVAVLGLAFKPHTNDMREAPSLKVIPYLLNARATVIGYDPQALDQVDRYLQPHPQLEFEDSISTAVDQADIIMALIEWPQITEFEFAKTKADKEQWFIDARNQFDQAGLLAAGYRYLGVGI
ncbi:MAG: hypothetical protein COU69_04740 [Candidatus Pacebacteria bacterium CG10_big_fil_rev_8_21_14_0_10_56_10]|nr:MAG: hypothetical protein COU69_04740 [Candidatus Pacebacteria bacterium CG10_big_fil_rev_8_21_14_0_10_56_10]